MENQKFFDQILAVPDVPWINRGWFTYFAVSTWYSDFISESWVVCTVGLVANERGYDSSICPVRYCNLEEEAIALTKALNAVNGSEEFDRRQFTALGLISDIIHKQIKGDLCSGIEQYIGLIQLG